MSSPSIEIISEGYFKYFTLLLTLLMNLNAFGPPSPPVVPSERSARQIDDGGSSNKKKLELLKAKNELILQEDDLILAIIKEAVRFLN